MAQNSENEKKKTVRTIIIGIVAGIIILAAGMGLGVVLFGEPSDTSLFARITSSNEDDATEIAIPLDEFLVNVQGETARSQTIVRLGLTVTSADEAASEAIASDIAKVRDAVLQVVSRQTASTLMEAKDGNFVIKDEIKDRINQSVGDDLIEDVYITNILIQK